MVYDNEVIEFYTNLIVLDNTVVSLSVHSVDLVFDKVRLGEIFHIPCTGLDEYNWSKEENCMLTSKFSQGRVTVHPRKVLKGKMSSFHKLVFEVVHKGILPRGERRHEAIFRDMGIGHALENMDPIDWPSLMIKHMARVVDPKRPHQLAYGNLLTTVFKEFGVPLKEGRLLNRNDMFTRSTLAECNLLDAADQVPVVPPRVAGPVATLLNELSVTKAQNKELRGEVLTL
ncbi:hypothetical protein KY289_027143 [Solanum tuberosum]|nr:hypothetical protein KY289_027143 [Solanum tuberosum]KAH0662031.1 hypothetical protein KY284_026962 [Solanum tuberosum]